jgi:ABC-2 type transport system ATP-binding protein
MTERGVTIFLISRVSEIVERPCTHMAIIHIGRLVAEGSWEELRSGVSGAEGEKKAHEQIFLSIARQSGGAPSGPEALTWLR